MQKQLTFYLSLTLLNLVIQGCSSLATPSSEAMAKLPVVKLGDNKPKHQEYIFHIPAHSNMPVTLNIKGSMIANNVVQTSSTQLTQDLYLYKHWASLDGQDWRPRNELVKMVIGIGVGPEGGTINIDIELLNKTEKKP